ncbi:MAG: hypothetical protein JSU09_16390 [Bacteroidetes bacterium]|nr:hypothetical protein [Bacteroidota bacterium]
MWKLIQWLSAEEKKGAPEEVPEKNDNEKKTKSFWKSIISFISSIMNLKLGILLVLIFYAIVYRELKKQKCVFEYTQIPEEIKKGGISEEYVVNSINDIMSRISNHEGDLRKISFGNSGIANGGQGEAGTPINKSSISGHEYISINSMNLEGIPFKTIVFVTDRILSFLGMDTDNYVSLEFYQKNERLNLSIQFDGHRQNFSTPYTSNNPDHAILSLCYQAAIFLLGETDPIHLVEYYFDVENFQESIKACISTIQRNKSDKEKSRSYFIWAMSSYTPELTSEALAKLRTAVALDQNNYPASLFLSSIDTDISTYKQEIRKLISHKPTEAILWYNWIDAVDRKTDLDSAYIASVYPEFKEIYDRLTYTQSTIPSEVYWSLGKRFEDWGKVRKVFFDSAISLYRMALEHEISRKDLSYRRVSEYYNAAAFAYQQRALAAVGVRPDTCVATIIPNKKFGQDLLNSYQYASQAVAADSLNPWAWSTLGEFYGLALRVKPTDKNLKLTFHYLQKAFHYGLDIGQFKDEYEPYCYLYKNHRKEFDKVLKTPLYYQGQLGQLRALRIVGAK